MQRIHSITGCRFFLLEHDNLLANRLKAEKFLNLLKELNKDNFTWGCSARLDSIRSIDHDLLKDAGCRKIYFGVESGSEKMQRIYKKSRIAGCDFRIKIT